MSDYTVRQEDRDAAEHQAAIDLLESEEGYGFYNDAERDLALFKGEFVIRVIKRARAEERERIVAWLRENVAKWEGEAAYEIADAIERGDHHDRP